MKCPTTIRQATTADIPLLVEAVIQAEKSGTNRCGLAMIFGMTEDKLAEYLQGIFEEEISGCEFSVDSFYIAENAGVPAAALASWIECGNADGLCSSTLKANLLAFHFPQEAMKSALKNAHVVRAMQIERTAGTLQFEYAYTREAFRGNGFVGSLMNARIAEIQAAFPQVKFAQLQTFSENVAARRAYEKLGFRTVIRNVAGTPELTKFFPGTQKILMQKEI